MSLRKPLVSLAIVLSIPVVVPRVPCVAYGLDLREKIEPFARPLIEDGAAVGFVVGIVKGGEEQVLAYGETEKGSGLRPDGDTVFEIGSITKVFTGVLLADFVERGLVKLDDPVQQYLPASVKVPVKGEAITLEHLATHSSGLPRLPDNMAPADPGNPYADYTVKQMYDFLSGHELRRPPGEFEYSNLGMGLLGHILARRARTSYEKLLIERICKPLGMKDTRIELNRSQRKRLAAPYDATGKRVKNWDLPTLAGAGAIRSTVSDMLKFVRANLRSADRRPLTRALLLSHRRRRDASDGLAVGLGWHIARDGATLWHNGMTGGYHGCIYVSRGSNVAVVVLANTATGRVSQLGEQIAQIAMGASPPPPKTRKVVELDPAVLKAYAGRYQLAPNFVLTVTVEGSGKDRLMVQATGQQKFQVFPESKTEFFYKVVDAQITFRSDEKGKVSELILHQGGRDMPARRI